MAGGNIITGTTDTSRIEAPVTVKAYLICAFAAFGGIFFGYDTGWMGDVLAMKYFIRQYTGLPYPDLNDATAVSNFHVSTRDQSLTTAILSAGTFFGAIIAGDVADFVGRRVTIITGCFIFSIGCILETASTGLAVMVVGRVIAGFGVGFISAIVILYLSVCKLSFHSSTAALGCLCSNDFYSSHAENRPQKSPRCARGWLSILYYHWYSSRKLCLLRDPESRRYWILSNSDCNPVLVGHDLGHRPIHPA